jgi:3-oxoacyl-[acyl-carrier-protein] synthase III
MEGIRLLGSGHALPGRKVTNEDLTQYVETSDEWIRSRTGIQSRYFSENEENADLAYEAARQALEDAGVEAKEIDLVIVATITPDYATPSMACILQKRLELRENIPAFDINAACSGFIYGLHVAYHMMHDSERRLALVVGCEQLSRILDLQDRSTCVLFGDGAGAALVEKTEQSRGFFGKLGAQGNIEALHVEGLGKADPYIRMDGKAVFRFAVKSIEENIKEVLEQTGLQMEEVDYFICHQANERILSHVRKKLKIPAEKLPQNIESYGNTSGASIPILLDNMKKDGRLVPGKKLFCIGFGGGLTYGSIYLEL